MGGNGTFSKGIDIPVEQREYRTICYLDDNIVVLQHKGKNVSLPEESHTPGRIYVAFRKDGTGIKEIAKYGDDHKRLWVIHTSDHHGMGIHVHTWKDGHPVEGSARPLNDSEKELYNKIISFKR